MCIIASLGLVGINYCSCRYSTVCLVVLSLADIMNSLMNFFFFNIRSTLHSVWFFELDVQFWTSLLEMSWWQNLLHIDLTLNEWLTELRIKARIPLPSLISYKLYNHYVALASFSSQYSVGLYGYVILNRLCSVVALSVL